MSVWQLVNQNSYAIAAGLVAVWAAVRVLRRGASPRSLALLFGLGAALVAPPFWVRSGAGGLGELDRALAAGRPTVLEVYSDL